MVGERGLRVRSIPWTIQAIPRSHARSPGDSLKLLAGREIRKYRASRWGHPGWDLGGVFESFEEPVLHRSVLSCIREEQLICFHKTGKGPSVTLVTLSCASATVLTQSDDG